MESTRLHCAEPARVQNSCNRLLSKACRPLRLHPLADRLVCFWFSHQPSVCKSEGFLQQQLKRLENRHRGHECSVSYRLMKQLDWKSFAIGVLLTTTVMFGTGAATSTSEKWDSNQRWELSIADNIYQTTKAGHEPYFVSGNTIFLRKRIK